MKMSKREEKRLKRLRNIRYPLFVHSAHAAFNMTIRKSRITLPIYEYRSKWAL